MASVPGGARLVVIPSRMIWPAPPFCPRWPEHAALPRPGQPSPEMHRQIILYGMRRLSPASDRLIVSAAAVPTARSASGGLVVPVRGGEASTEA